MMTSDDLPEDVKAWIDASIGASAAADELIALADEADRILAEPYDYDYLIQLLEAQESDDDTDDDLRTTLVDDGQRGGVIVERLDRPTFGDRWIDFSTGDAHEYPRRLRISVSLDGQKQGLHLVIAGHVINESVDEIWTVADLRQLRDDIDRVLADERFRGALAEQAG